MLMSSADASALLLSVKLACVTTMVLMAIGIPLAWWLARSRGFVASMANVLVALPLVLPPSVLGFYLLLAMGPNGPIGAVTQSMSIGSLAFSFEGLVVASVLYSLPFVVQPLQAAFASVPQRMLDATATLGTKPMEVFLRVALPMSRRGLLVSAILGFAHTIGEFGVVLMIGGSIPDETRVVSVQIYDHVEALDYASAHQLSLTLVVFSILVLTLVYWIWDGSHSRSSEAAQ
ncbi:MAG: molybdate ABC transporter permease subunit [Pseudomonadota bacterium]